MSVTAPENDKWDISIKSKHRLFEINAKEIWHYRDLLLMFIRKDIVTIYKQTILGPIWFMAQPIFTAITYAFIFGHVAKISTNNAPPVLFYLGSVTLWNYFSETFTTTSKTFADNSAVLGKVYFPRLVLPLSKVASGLIKLLIQFSIFIIFWLYHFFIAHTISPNWYVLLFPFLLLIFAAFSLGFGILITSFTTKYRDLNFILAFGIQLLFYATPVIYPISVMNPDKQFILWLNPLSSLFEAFKYAFLGEGFGILNYFWLSYSIGFTAILLMLGIIVFNKAEKKFIDTI